MTRTTAIVAGVAPGLGETLCARLAARGHRVLALARSDRMEGRLAEGVELRRCDLTDPAQVARATQDAGEVAVCLHTAHRLLIAPFADTPPAEFEAVWRDTCLSAMVTARAVLPGMAARGRGTLVFTGATAAIRGGAKFAAFASAKFALRGLAQSLAREYQPQGVHIAHAVIDGLVWEEQTRARFSPDEAACIAPDAIADAYLALIDQPRSAWTQEMDLRPFSKSF